MSLRKLPALVLGALLVAALACEAPIFRQIRAPEDPEALEALGMDVALLTSAAGGAATTVEESPVPEATDTATPPPPEPSATPTVVHSVFPSSPSTVKSFMTDRSSKALASEGRAIGDNFDQLLFERPFTSQAMEYRGYLDITRGEMSASPPFFYVTIFLEEGAPPEATPYYGVEIDIDKDGRGDWLIWGMVPPDSQWTTDNVMALSDTENDIGNEKPVLSDPPQAGNGYDNTAFDSGQGPDPDAAWIRRSPTAPSHIEIAFKQTLIGPPGQFLWGVWADEGTQDPTWFDYNDHFTISEAGSPVITTNYYPLAELALLDNSCRWGYGYEPVGNEPGVCYVPPTPTPTSPPPPPEPTATPTIYLILY